MIEIGERIDGIWEIDSLAERHKHRSYYKVVNIFNGTTIIMSNDAINRVKKKQSKVSTILRRKIWKETKLKMR